jgi:glycosyltransferase involved in cell wall biosynthesis
MNILFVNEKCGYFGGVEQNIADSVSGLQNGSKSTPSILEIIDRTSPDVVYFHKTGDLGFHKLPRDLRTVRMVHDHDLCCPRRHKYFAWSGKVCHYPAGWRCWLDGAFLGRSPNSLSGFSWVSVRRVLRRMRENQSLDSLLVGSHAMRQELVKNGFPKENIHILAPVVRLTPIEPCVVPKEPNILYVGQLIRGKGVDLLLHALNQLDCDFTATIIGTGNAKAKLETLSQQLKLDEKVRFLGWVSHDDLSKYYSRSKVVAVPSRWPEPFGMIGLEAMLHGRPVIAFEVGGIPDWLEHEKSGLLVPEQDTKAFAEALQKLLSNTSLAAEFGENGRMIVKQCFGFEEYLDRLEAHLFGTPTDASKKTQTHSNDRHELS